MKRATLISVLILVLSFCLVSPLQAQNYKTTYVKLGNGVPGVFYEPLNPGAKAEVAIMHMHNGADILASTPCIELAKRGYRILCANASNSKSGFMSDMDEDTMILNLKLGMAYLRHDPDVKKVILMGHSGGGGLAAAYQNIAENGVKVCQGPEMLVKCPDTLAGLPAADGLILLDSTYSQAVSTMLSLDPAVVHSDSGQDLDPSLDMFNPANGYNPKGSTYSEEFKKRFFAKQSETMNQLIAKAEERLALIEAGKGEYVDDEPFLIHSNPSGNQLFQQDLSLWSHTRKAWPLLHPDGTISTEIVHTVRVPTGGKSRTPSLERGAIRTTVRAFLSTFAVRTTNDFGYEGSTIHGIDFQSNYANTVGALEGVHVPLLQMGNTGSNEYFMAETAREHAKSSDKTLAYVEGSVHGFTPCTKCALAQGKPAGYYGDTVKTVFDYVDGWLSKPGRFATSSR
jgi:hypothetical protein